MYRKYTPAKTSVLNPFNYLIDTLQISNNQKGIFHQVLISSESLPTLLDHKNVEMIISQSENQNCIQEGKEGFQFYLQQNLLQIRLRPTLKPICLLSELPIRNVLKMIVALNLDFLIAVKHIKSIIKHNQSSLNNLNKFYSQFMTNNGVEEMVLLFIDEERVFYYDLYFQEKFCKNKEAEKEIDDRALRNRLSAKKGRKKSELAGESVVMNSDELVFQKYIFFIAILLENTNLVESAQEVRKMIQSEQITSGFYEKMQRLKQRFTEKTAKDLLELLKRCIDNSQEYNINIFSKQCELLLEKHERLQQNTKQDSKKPNNIEPKEEKTKTSKSCLVLKKENKMSMQTEGRRPSRQKQQKLKNSKSMISLKFNSPAFFTSKSRPIKNPFGILSKTKEKFLDKTNTFQSSFTSLGNQKHRVSIVSNHQLNAMAMSEASSNWFNQTISQKQSIIKLRNFKKSNNFNLSASNTPTNTGKNQSKMGRSFFRNSEKAKQEIERASQQQLDRLSKLLQAKSKASTKEIQEKMDMCTMTQQAEEKNDIKEEQPIQKSQVFRREIVNTISFKYNEQVKKVEQKREEKEAKEKKAAKASGQQKKMKEIHQQIVFQPKKYKEEIAMKPIVAEETHKEIEITKELTQSKFIKQPKQQKKKRTSFDQSQIQQVSFTKKKGPKIQDNTSIMNNNSSLHNTSIMQKKPKVDEQLTKTAKNPQTSNNLSQNKQKNGKLTVNILAQQQKAFYTSQFQSLLKFFKTNTNKLNFPARINITFIVNFSYYKSLLQYRNVQDRKALKPLVDIITKKQQKIKEQLKSQCLLYRVDFDSLWQRSKVIKKIESQMREGIDQNYLRHRIIDCRQQIDLFYTLSTQASKLLQVIFDELTTFIQSNKPALIQANAFSQALQLIYLLTLIIIISLQRESYYKLIIEGKYSKLQECFKFKYEDNVDEYLQKYRATLESRNMASISVKEECTFLKSWYDQYR